MIYVLSLAFEAQATKPCEPSPCENSAGQFDRAKCVIAADWIAQGTITDVRHHLEGNPTNKDFAEFTFNARAWEKRKDLKNTFHFKVGWCNNRQVLPESTKEFFRVFGINSNGVTETGPQYLYLEPVTKKKKL